MYRCYITSISYFDMHMINPLNYCNVSQMEVNPEFRVAELDYNNNVARCDVNYSGFTLYVSNCVVESLIRRRKRN